MKHTWKRLALAVALALLCVPAAFAEVVQPVVEPGSSDSSISATPLTLGQTAQAVIAEQGGYAYFSFIPEETDYYSFTSISEIDTYGYLYDAEMNGLMSDDDSGTNNNFNVTSQLEAGRLYYFGARYYSSGNTGSFDVVLNYGNPLMASSVGNNTRYVRLGETDTLSVEVSSPRSEVHYQWYNASNGTLIEGATGPNCTTEPVSQYTQYYCSVTDDFNNLRQVWFYLFVQNDLVVDRVGDYQVSVAPGETVTLGVNATCAQGELSYSWSKSWNDENWSWHTEPIDGATGGVYTIDPVEHSATYWCYVTDEYGNQASTNFSVFVDNQLVIERMGDDDVYVKPGEAATLEVSAACAQGELSYRWSKGWHDENGSWHNEIINGATGSVYTTDPIVWTFEYSCYVMDEYGNQTTTNYFVSVDNQFVVERMGQEYLSLAPGDITELALNASCASGDLHYAWYFETYDVETGGYIYNNTPIEGAKDAVYNTDAVTGRGRYHCTVTDDYGNAQTVYFYINIDSGFNVRTSDETYYDALYGETVELSVDATCDSPLHYEWHKLVYEDDDNSMWTLIEDAQGSSYTTEPIERYAEYRCRVFDDYGNSKTCWFYIDIDNGFGIDQYDVSVVVPYGQPATLVASAYCDVGELHYEWNQYKWNEEIDDGDYVYYDETGSTFVTEPVTEATEYRCEVYDDFGNSGSITFTVGVENGFRAERVGPRKVYWTPNTQVTLAVDAECADGELTYRWTGDYYNPEIGDWDWDELEEDGPSHTLTSSEGRGWYYCYVTDKYGNSEEIVFNVVFRSELHVEPVGDTVIHVNAGEPVTMKVSVTGAVGEVHFSWEGGSGEISDANGPEYTVESVTETTLFRCLVREDGQSDDSIGVEFLVIVDTHYDTLSLNTPENISLESGESKVFSFTPAETGYYTIKSTGSDDSYVHLYDADFNMIAEDDDGGEETNFLLSHKLEAGQTYYYIVHGYGYDAASFTVTLTVGSDTGDDEQHIRGTINLRIGQTVVLPGWDGEEMVETVRQIMPEDETIAAGQGDRLTAVGVGTTMIEVEYGEDEYDSWSRRYNLVVLPDESGFTLPAALSEIESQAFMGVPGITVLELSGNVTRVRSDAFNGTGLKQLIVNNDKTILGGASLRGTENVTIVCHEGSRAERYARNTGLMYVYLP